MSGITLNPYSAILIEKVNKLEKKVSEGQEKNPKGKIKRILEIMESIEQENAENLGKEKFMGLALHQWKIIRRGVLALGFLSATASAFASVLSTEAQNEMNCTVPEPVVATTTTAASFTLIACIAEFVFDCFASKKNEHFKLIKEKCANALLLKMFFQAYKEFIDSEEKNLSGCVEELKKTPEKTMHPKIRDRWLSLLIQALPENSSLKKKLIKQKELAEQIKNGKEIPVESNRAFQLESTMHSPSSSEEADSSLSEEEEVSSPFLDEEEAVTAAPRMGQLVTLDLLKEDYFRNFQGIQQELNFEVNELNYGGLWFDQKCQIFDSPPWKDTEIEMINS